MIYQLTVILFFTLISQGANAGSKQVDFCKDVTGQLLNSDGTLAQNQINELASKLPNNEKPDTKEMDKISKLIYASKGVSPAETEKKCNENFRKYFTNFAQRVGGVGKFAGQMASTKEEENANKMLQGNEKIHIKRASEARPASVGSLCDEIRYNDCQTQSAMLFLDLEKVASYNGPQVGPDNAAFSPNDCECFQEKSGFNEAKIVAKAGHEYGQIDNLIIKAAGKKFLNDFAIFYEDMRFYESSSAWALKNKETDKVDDRVLCNDPNAFKKVIDVTCAANGTTQGKDARINELLGVYGDSFSDHSNNFSKGFNGLVNDIESYSITPKGSSGSGGVKPIIYTRKSFEEVRFGFSQKLPEVSFVDELIAVISRDPELKLRVDNLISNKGQPMTPLAALEEILSTKKSDTKLIKQLLRRMDGNKNKKVIAKLKASLDSGNFDEARSEVFKKGLSFHPGLKNLLLEPALFQKASARVRRGAESIVNRMEEDKELIEFFAQKCEALQKKFAEAVCTKPSDLKKKVNTQEMVKILANEGMLNNPDREINGAISSALCLMNSNKVPVDSAFSGFDAKSDFAISDYQDRKANPNPADQNNLLSNYAIQSANNPTLEEEFHKVAQSSSYGRISSGQMSSDLASASSGPRSSNGELNSSAFGGGDIKSAAQSLGSAVANTEASPQNSEPVNNGNSAHDQSSGQFNQSAPISNTPLIPQFSATPVDQREGSKIDEIPSVKEELKNTLSGNTKTPGLVENINEEDAQDLLDLREMARKDKAIISDMNLEKEKRKTIELESKYMDLQKKLDQLIKEKNEVVKNPSTERSNEGSPEFKGPTFTNFSENSNSAGGQPTGGARDGSSLSNSGVSQSGSGNLRAPASGSGNAANFRDAEPKSDQQLIIVSHSTKGHKASEDPSAELISYLNQNETDSKTLKDLKESGLIYSYVVDENGKRVEKKKVIKYDELSVEAKALVDKKISILFKNKSDVLKQQLSASKRAYSIQALKLELLSAEVTKSVIK